MAFAGSLAIVSGGASGMGRELVRQLSRAGASVAFSDIRASSAKIDETLALATQGATGGAKITAHFGDVADESAWQKFRKDALSEHGRTSVELLFNNAGLVGGGSFVEGSRDEWDRTFNILFYGVYYGCRTFMPDLIKAKSARIVNTSSVCGFWASGGPNMPHTAYCTAKFAVKGFTESLMTDLALNAPHVKASVVMPGWIGTPILGSAGVTADLTENYVSQAPLDAEAAASIILAGVERGDWRILVGDDAVELDKMVRQRPEEAYTKAFWDETAKFGFLDILRVPEREPVPVR
ncbi:short-chain dehydrogenase [Hyaloraphidium curvatum]|nr:short-chain dehydrogenase [Hyaloraphidium curvatum]